MKPLKVTMQAFGSYGRKTEIDFTVPDQNLFLITGDTGAGKTTIFDALVFALYGATGSASNKKDGAELQSQFAGYDREPFVELTFLEQSGEKTGIYTVRRVPRHIRPLKRRSKEGFKEEKETVSLIMPDGLEYSRNVKETDKKLEEIVGLTREQFMQVAMIAQGEFMELLRARSDDKKVIFRKLFNTQMYQDVVEELGRRRKEKMSEIARIRTACQTEVGHLVLNGDSGQEETLRGLRNRILSSDRLSVTDMEALLEELGLLCGQLKEKKEQTQKQYDTAGQIRDARRDALSSARNLLKFFGQLSQAVKELEECKEQEEEIRAAADLMAQIHAAYEIRTVYQRYRDADATVKDTEKKLKEQQEVLPGRETAYQNAAAAEAEAKEEQAQELAAFSKVSERVAKARERFAKIRTAVLEVKAEEAAAKKADDEAAAAKGRLERLERQEKNWREQSETLKDAQMLLALWEVKHTEADALTADAAAVKKAQRDVAGQRKKAERAAQEYEEAKQKYQETNKAYVEMQNAFLDAQAGILAKSRLKAGEPCPVCGSTHHPRPCELSVEHQNLTREAVDELGRNVGELQMKWNRKASASKSAKDLLDERERNFVKAMDALRERMSGSIPKIPDALTPEQAEALLGSWKEALMEEGVLLKKNADTFAAVQQSLKGIEEKKQSLRTLSDQAEKKAVDAKTALAGSRAALEGLKASGDYQTEAEAEHALTEAKGKKEAKDAAYAAAHRKAQSAKTAREKAGTLVERYTKELPALREEQAARRVSYESILQEKALTEEEWIRITERHDRTETDDLQTRIEEYKKKKAAAESMQKYAREAIGEQKHPVLEELEAAMQEAEELLRSVQKQLEQCKEEYRVNQAVYDALAPKMEERNTVTQEYTRMDSLYNRLSGKVSGARMDIETFVQRYYLERILHAANVRFQEMSAGQFELRMYDIEKAGEGKNRGLDLMVYSAITGKEREVRTLSGGESFMAALSLALGMADQIQESSASIHLDVMFIDEGFGSLDDHARNQAVKVLQQMAGGSRQIGIISHVTELKQEIEDQLIVSKDDGGSHIRWQIS